MPRTYSSITPALVRSLARSALRDALDWKPYGRLVTVTKLLDLLLLLAALRSSLSAVAKRFRFGFSHETARKAAHANLPDLARLTGGLVDALFSFADRSWFKKGRYDLAIDTHDAPFYGDKHTPGVVGGRKKHGTHRFFRYATACLVHRRRRFTVGLAAVTGKLKPHEVVAALLAQAQSRGLRPRGVVLDSGFDSGEVILLLQEKGLSYVVPLRRKGKGGNRRNAVFALPGGTATEVDWVTDVTRRPVRTEAWVVKMRHKPGVAVYAFGGWGPATAGSALRRARLARRGYRRRFGVETSYRQMNEGKGLTTGADVGWRLLLVGVGLLLRQAWVWLTRALASDRGTALGGWVGEMPLAVMLGWLSDVLRGRYPESKHIDLNDPIPLPVQE